MILLKLFLPSCFQQVFIEYLFSNRHCARCWLKKVKEAKPVPRLEDRKKNKNKFAYYKKKKTHNPSIEIENKSGGKHFDRLAFKQRLKPGEDTEKNIPDRSKSWNKGSKK